MSTQQVLDHDLDAGGHSIMTSLGSVVTIDTGKITIQNGNAFPITVGEGEYDDALTWISTAGWELGSVVYLMAQGPIPVAPSVSTPPAGFGAILLPNGVTSLTLAASETAQFVLTGAGWLYVSAPRSVIADDPLIQLAVLTGDFSVTSNTALAPVAGLYVNLKANTTYRVDAHLHIVSGDTPNNGGVRFSLDGTATAVPIDLTAIWYQEYPDPVGGGQVPLLGAVRSIFSFSSSGGEFFTVGTRGILSITGTITTTGAGNLYVRFAQAASKTSPSILGLPSSLMVTRAG